MHEALLWTLSIGSSLLSLAIAIDSHRMQRHAHRHVKRFHPHIVWREEDDTSGTD